jgi:hypothetical protein
MKKPRTQKPIYWVDRELEEFGGRVNYWMADEYGLISMISREEYQLHKIEELLEKILKKIK